MRLLRAVDQQRLHPAVKSKAIQTASAHPNPVVRDLFERFVPEEKRKPRLGTSIDAGHLLSLRGNAARGGELFFNASAVNCQTCHQIGGKGRDVGPDLSHIGKKYNRAKSWKTCSIRPRRSSRSTSSMRFKRLTARRTRALWRSGRPTRLPSRMRREMSSASA